MKRFVVYVSRSGLREGWTASRIGRSFYDFGEAAHYCRERQKTKPQVWHSTRWFICELLADEPPEFEWPVMREKVVSSFKPFETTLDFRDRAVQIRVICFDPFDENEEASMVV